MTSTLKNVKKGVENVPTILIGFDPKEASPLEVINTLNKILEQNPKGGKITW